MHPTNSAKAINVPLRFKSLIPKYYKMIGKYYSKPSKWHERMITNKRFFINEKSTVPKKPEIKFPVFFLKLIVLVFLIKISGSKEIKNDFFISNKFDTLLKL